MLYAVVVLIILILVFALLVHRWSQQASQPLRILPAETTVPAGARLATQSFELLVNQDAETVTLRAQDAMHKTPADVRGGLRRPVDLTFPAAGFSAIIVEETQPLHRHNRRRAERTPDTYAPHILVQNGVRPSRSPAVPLVLSGTCTITFKSRRHPFATEDSDSAKAEDTVEIRNVPGAQAEEFRRHFGEVQGWISHVESALQKRVEAHQHASQLAQKKAEMALARTSQTCDFKPSHRAMGFDFDGEVVWALNVNEAGRCWVYADGKIYQGPLKGGKVVAHADYLELMVRDAKWENSYFSRRKMKLFMGSDPEVLAQWSKKIAALIQD